MDGREIFAPFFGMVLLTFVVWLFMYVRRLRFIVTNRIDTRRLTTPEKGASLIPEEVSWPAYNLRNLFEMPVLFYALCLYLFVTNSVDHSYVISAWLFFGLRVLHSLIHSTVNIVNLRFSIYMLSAFVLWFMLIRAALQLFSG